MQKIYIGLAALAVAGVILIGVFGGNKNQEQGQINNQKNGIVNPSGSYSINELFAMNRPMKCSWKENATGDSDVTNIIYINGKKFYQDVTMGDIGHSFTISNGEYLYIWNDFNDAASKIKNTGAETGINSEQGNTGQEQKKDFVCESWSPDDSIFNPPQNKNFQDVTDEMNKAFDGVDKENIKQQVCDSCQNAPTQELKDLCLENAQCL